MVMPDFIDSCRSISLFIFNVADIFITVGVFFIILLEFTNINTKDK